ncbi:MAG: hypothetical protein CVV11_01925 [Gammaproteobacteria bacterium HGW-Gammaproteobacteria-15]|nr:MAG: hypothetical protein CVV11_01925 [Gammaproteobacteria bacterium HGW-Gammaproteobacteria-15]
MNQFHSKFLKVPDNPYLRTIQKVCTSSNFIYLTLFFILALGVLLHYLGFSNAIGRSGAILVAVAVTLVYLNHYFIEVQSVLSFRSQQLKDLCESSTERVSGDSEAHQKLASLENFALQLDESVDSELTQNKIVYANLIKAEFVTGVIGTFVWGFGDLIPAFT